MKPKSFAEYVIKYKDRYNLIQKHDTISQKTELLTKEKDNKLLELSKLTMIFVDLKKRNNEMINMQKQINVKSEAINSIKIEIEKYSKLCDDKLSGIAHYKKILDGFIQLLKEDNKQNEKKL